MAGLAGLVIVKVDATVVRVPRPARFRPRTAKGAPTFSEYVVIELHTDGGHVGLGEATTSSVWSGEDAVATADLLVHKVGPDLIGANVSDWAGVKEAIRRSVCGRPFLRAAIEMACLDAEGIARGLPVAVLLGGINRTTFDTKIVLPAREPDLVGAMATDAKASGARAVKVKVGLDLASDVDRLRVVRSVVEDLPMSVDANEGWDPDIHTTIAEEIGPVDLVAVEQPFPRAAVSETRRLRDALESAVVADESVWTRADLAAIAADRAFSDVSLYPGKVGGLRRCVRLAGSAATQGLDVSYGSNLELGIGAAAMAHTMAATPHLSSRVASDLIGPLYFEHALVDDVSFVGFSGAMLPDGAGLGVRLDHDALAEYAVPGESRSVSG